MPVFLSHKKEDKDFAITIAEYLRKKEIICYIDVFDPDLQTTDDITSTLMQRVKSCSHLMAVISKYTEKSWWVPFEIGVASEINRRITSFQIYDVSLPQFLTKWPILKSKDDLDKFVYIYRHDKVINLSERKTFMTNIDTADQFHRQLKASLGQ